MARCFLYKSTSFNVYWTLFSFIFIETNVAGQLTLTPMSVAPVCRVGDPLQLTCTAMLTRSIQTIRWRIFRVIDDQGTLSEITNSVIIDNSDDIQRKIKEVAYVTFTYARISAQGASPLISTLSIDSVSIGLNGTFIRCSDVADPTTSASTTIEIIDTNKISIEYIPILSIVDRHYDLNNVTITVEWTHQHGVVSYDIRISPSAPKIIINGNTSRRLMVSYNIEYNLSIIAVTSCGNAIASVTLNYGNCGYPDLLSTIGNDSVMSNESDSSFSAGPTMIAECSESVQIEGCTITFSCPPGLGLTGSNSVTCAGNGEWEPDPSGLMCTVNCGAPLDELTSSVLVMGYNGVALKGDSVSFTCSSGLVLSGPNSSMCMGNGKWEPDPREVACRRDDTSSISHQPLSEAGKIAVASASVVLVTFAVAFTVGYVTSHCCRKKSPESVETNTSPLYDTIQSEHSKRDVVMSENIAYSTVQPSL